MEELRSSRLRLAIGRARVEEAERSEVIADLREAELARLELLQERLRPLFADVPAGVDTFDMGLMPGERPRLFVDMIAFIEMGHDRRSYRFMQDTRDGRVLIVESQRIEALTEAVTNYVARRLVEREKALASTTSSAPRVGLREALLRSGEKIETDVPAPRPRLFLNSLNFAIDVLGSALLFTLLGIGIWTVAVGVSGWVRH
jgi:hypothetical protein